MTEGLLTVGCQKCGRRLKIFADMLRQRLQRGHGCTFCGGELEVPRDLLDALAVPAADASRVEQGRCLGCLRPVRKPSGRRSERDVWSCMMCGATMLPPDVDGGTCATGPRPGQPAAGAGDVAAVTRALQGLPPWVMRIGAILNQRAVRGEVSLAEARALVDEAVQVARWQPTGGRQLLPLSALTLEHLLPSALYLVFSAAERDGDEEHFTLRFSVPDIVKADPDLPLPTEAVWGPGLKSLRRQARLKRVGGAIKTVLESMDDSYGPTSASNPTIEPHCRVGIHLHCDRRPGGYAITPGTVLLGLEPGPWDEPQEDVERRFYEQLGRLAPVTRRYLTLAALFGPLMRGAALDVTRAAVGARLEALGLPVQAAAEIAVEARRTLAPFKRLVGLGEP